MPADTSGTKPGGWSHGRRPVRSTPSVALLLAFALAQHADGDPAPVEGQLQLRGSHAQRAVRVSHLGAARDKAAEAA